jgi:hypothetical protein
MLVIILIIMVLFTVLIKNLRCFNVILMVFTFLLTSLQGITGANWPKNS